MGPNSKASIPIINGCLDQLNKQNRQKVPPLVIKKTDASRLSNQDDSNSPSPNSDDEFRSSRKTARARDSHLQAHLSFPDKIASRH